MRGQRQQEASFIKRHGWVEIAEHWAFAISGLVLVFSGFGELPMYKRYMLTELPLLGWTGDFYIQLKIHYLAALVFVSTGVFHMVYHGLAGHRGLVPKRGDLGSSLRTLLALLGLRQEPPAHKYLPEQRLAYVYLAFLGAILSLTGILKVIKNLEGVFLPPELVTWVTLVHTFATIFFLLGILAHLGALIMRANRPLLRGIFTGKVDASYVRRRHILWWNQLREKGFLAHNRELYEGQNYPLGVDRDASRGPLGQGAPDGTPLPGSSPDGAPGSYVPSEQ